MDSKSGFGLIGGVTKCAPLKFSLLTVLAWVFCIHFGGF